MIKVKLLFRKYQSMYYIETIVNGLTVCGKNPGEWLNKSQAQSLIDSRGMYQVTVTPEK